jgi:hypothetical protein
MSSFPCNTGDVPVFPAQFQDLSQKRASVLRHIASSERLAEVRLASRLEVRPKPEMLTTGISEIDAMTGGIPGAASLNFMGQLLREKPACCWQRFRLRPGGMKPAF